MLRSRLSLAIAFLVLFTGCQRAQERAAETAARETPATETTITPQAAPAETATETVPTAAPVKVMLSEFKIEMPASLKAGSVTFEVTNSGKRDHNFEVEGQGIEKKFEQNLKPGETRTMQIDLVAGTYKVYCPVKGHAQRGMSLQLTVTG
jgi:uncharacterized cupredoxin-like copper-binding protein